MRSLHPPPVPTPPQEGRREADRQEIRRLEPRPAAPPAQEDHRLEPRPAAPPAPSDDHGPEHRPVDTRASPGENTINLARALLGGSQGPEHRQEQQREQERGEHSPRAVGSINMAVAHATSRLQEINAAVRASASQLAQPQEAVQTAQETVQTAQAVDAAVRASVSRLRRLQGTVQEAQTTLRDLDAGIAAADAARATLQGLKNGVSERVLHMMNENNRRAEDGDHVDGAVALAQQAADRAVAHANSAFTRNQVCMDQVREASKEAAQAARDAKE